MLAVTCGRRAAGCQRRNVATRRPAALRPLCLSSRRGAVPVALRGLEAGAAKATGPAFRVGRDTAHFHERREHVWPSLSPVKRALLVWVPYEAADAPKQRVRCVLKWPTEACQSFSYIRDRRWTGDTACACVPARPVRRGAPRGRQALRRSLDAGTAAGAAWLRLVSSA